jgi:hypothetical protein
LISRATAASCGRGIERDAQELQLRPERRIQLQVVHHLDHGGRPQQRDERGEGQREVADPQFLQPPERGDPQVHHDQAGDAAGRVHHHEQEDQPQVQQPGLGELRQQHEGQHQQHAADDGAEEDGGAAQEREEQVRAGAVAAHDLRGHDLEVQRREPARDAGEKGGDHERQVAHLLRVVADELHPLGVVAHRVEHAPERRAGEGEHERRAHEGVDGDQVVQLDLRPEGDAEGMRARHAVAGDAALAAEELREHQRRGIHQLADAQRDHREGRAGLLGRDVAEEHREGRGAEAAHDGDQADRQVPLALAHQVERVDLHEGPQKKIHREAETEHAPLSEQHVEREADDDGDAHLAEHRVREAAGEHERREREQHRIAAPDDPAARVEAP